MKLLVCFLVIAFTSILTAIAVKARQRIDEAEKECWDDTPRPKEISDLFKRWRIVFYGMLLGSAVLFSAFLDNWQTSVTLALVVGILPMLVMSFGRGAIFTMVTLVSLLVIWQLPTTTARENRVVDEIARIATLSSATGRVDAMVVEDRGQYLFLKEHEDGTVSQEMIPADIVSGHYADEDKISVVIYHYEDLYKRTFWSKERNKFVNRKLTGVDLYVKRDQLLNTF